MTLLNIRGGSVGIAGALILGAGAWAASTEAAPHNLQTVDVHAAVVDAFGGSERADSVLAPGIPTPVTLQQTLEQRRAGGGGGQTARPRQRGDRRAPTRGGGGRRTAIVRGGRSYSPYYYGYGYPYGYGYGNPYYGAGYYGYYGGGYSYTGSVRLKVKPRHAEVLVDGYYVGTVDDFDGTFQSLRLEPGPASIEVRAADMEDLRLDVMILAGRKITYEANMRAGESGQAPPPSAARRPSARGPDRESAEVRPDPRDRDAESGPPPGFDGRPPVFGGVRLRVEPRNAQVFVDGYYVGMVDHFDGGRGLALESGPQSIEIRAAGYESLQIKVRILPDETITYEGELTEAPDQ